MLRVFDICCCRKGWDRRQWRNERGICSAMVLFAREQRMLRLADFVGMRTSMTQYLSPSSSMMEAPFAGTASRAAVAGFSEFDSRDLGG
jgi:hypothetical protein